MNAFAFDADLLTAVIAALLAIWAIYQAFIALRGRAFARAIFACAAAIVASLIALFFSTFQIKLM